MPGPPTPPARQKGCAAPGGPLPDLFCDEIMPKTTSWPPEHKPWPFQAPPPPPPPDRGPPTVAAVSPLPSSRDPTRVVGTPVRVERVSRHARPCRMSELEKLAARIEKLERTLCELSERIDASSRKRHSQPVNQPGCGGTILRIRRLDRGYCPHLVWGGVDDEQLLARQPVRRVLARHALVGWRIHVACLGSSSRGARVAHGTRGTRRRDARCVY